MLRDLEAPAVTIAGLALGVVAASYLPPVVGAAIGVLLLAFGFLVTLAPLPETPRERPW